MNVLTIKSKEEIPAERQLDVHYDLGMEKYTDYVIRYRKAPFYSATISCEQTKEIIESIVAATAEFPEYHFVIDDLDMEQNTGKRYEIHRGEIIEERTTGWEW